MKERKLSTFEKVDLIRKQVKRIEEEGAKASNKIKAFKLEAEEHVFQRGSAKKNWAALGGLSMLESPVAGSSKLRGSTTEAKRQSPGRGGSHLTDLRGSNGGLNKLSGMNLEPADNMNFTKKSPVKRDDTVELAVNEKLMKAKALELMSKIKLLDAFVDN